MLEIRPNCELCDKDLPADSLDARVCSYECTFCADCATGVLNDVCPTCGGGFAPRPIRPRRSWRPELNLGLANHPAGTARKHCKFTTDEIASHVQSIKDIAPQDR